MDVVQTDGVGIVSGGVLDGQYQLLQLHFHWGSNNSIGSEHTFDGQRYSLTKDKTWFLEGLKLIHG